MATNDDPTPGMTTPSAPDDTPSIPALASSPPAAARSGVPTAVAITGIAVGSALLLGLTFAGGVALGQVLPDGRGPGGLIAVGLHGDRDGAQLERLGERVEQRMDERNEQREDR